MVGSVDSLEFCPEMPITEKNAIPLDCWHDINLSNVWIPSHLLPNRTKPSNMRVPQGIYHTLEKKDASKYVRSFSVYSFASVENEQEEIFISDSEDDIFGSDPAISEKMQVSENTLPAIANVCPQSSMYFNELGNSNETNILNKNLEKGNRHINSKKNLIVSGRISPYLDEICQEEKFKKVISSNENLINVRKIQQNDSGACAKSLSNSINTGSQKHFAVFKKKFEDADGVGDSLNKVTDPISLKDILDDTPQISMKDFVFDFKKKDDPLFLCSYDNTEKKEKKKKKNKVKKKGTQYVALDNFLENNTEDTQDYYCDKYLQNLLSKNQKDSSYSNVKNNEDFPELEFDRHAPSQFIHSNKTKTKKCVKSSFNDFIGSEEINENILDESNKTVAENDIKSSINDLTKSEEINESENNMEEIKPYVTDAAYGKIVIENIPSDATKDDILGLLYGNGEIINFSLVSAGKYLTAYIELELNCDIDWIIECLNGTEPFGASTKKIFCYKQ